MTREEPLSLYIHIPFCTLKCSYCDFNSYAGIEEMMGPFVEALVAEIRLWGEVAAQGWGPVPPKERGRAGCQPAPTTRGGAKRRVETVFFGGGTPSLLPLEEIERVMEALRESFDLEPQAEVSLEANPGTIDLAYLQGLVSIGINRLSFGVQSFHDDELKALDRIHSAAEAKQGYRWAREAGFQRVNLDLIYGLSFDSPDSGRAEALQLLREPSATPRADQDERRMERWQATLEQAIELAPEHLSLYALTVEEGTKLAYDISHGRAAEPDGDMQASMYEWSSERLGEAGYRQYEISNWSRPGEECRHNLVYWRNGEWLGLGPGAHGQVSGVRCQVSGVNEKRAKNGEQEIVAYRFADVYSPKQYIRKVKETVDGWSKEQGARSKDGAAEVLKLMRQATFVESQSVEMAMADTAILGLRLNEGLDVCEFERRFGRRMEDVYGPVLAEMTEFGLLERGDGRIRLTARGRLLANEVFVRLLA